MCGGISQCDGDEFIMQTVQEIRHSVLLSNFLLFMLLYLIFLTNI